MSAISGAGEWKPKERCDSSRTLLLRPSMRPLESPRRMAARMPSRLARGVLASLMNGLSLLRDAHASHALRCAGASAGSSRW